jgi:adenosylcobinamide-GDP ribazoletransferase
MRTRLAEEAASAILAVQFLTRLPVPPGLYTPARMTASPRWYPAVGLLVGSIAGLVYAAAVLAFPPQIAAALAVGAGVLLTGCLHEDGFADTCDGLGGGATVERALTIMRDSRIGTYGAVALVLMLATKILTLGALPQTAAPAVLVAGHAASRASVVAVMATSRYLRADGAATRLSVGIGGQGLAFALATGGLAILGPLAVVTPLAAAGGFVGLALGHGLMRRIFERRLSGYTGDCLGAIQQTSELGFYLGVLSCL